MSAGDSSNYDKVRDAIPSIYELTGEAYRKKFRYTRREADETFKEWSVKLTGFLDWWFQIEEITEFSRLREVLVMEQLLNACSPELRVWLNRGTQGS